MPLMQRLMALFAVGTRWTGVTVGTKLADLLIVLIACQTIASAHANPTQGLAAASPEHSSMAFVHLFEWKWDDVAKECEDFLGPKGYTAVQISPATEHIRGNSWWTRYQPVSYKLESRSGNETAFISMVQRCKAVGVGIYADIVMNHMADTQSLTHASGIGGSNFGQRMFDKLYTPQDFHHTPGDLSRNCRVNDYTNRTSVQYCDLLGLADLCTGCAPVQEKIAAHVNRLGQLGISGFRVDAAKHMDAGELHGILRRINSSMYRYLEVISMSQREAVHPSMYYHLGAVTEFRFPFELSNHLLHGSNKSIQTLGESWGMMPKDVAISFVDNHDTQRGHAGTAKLTYKSGSFYLLANILMLAHPYGYPQVKSSYYWTDSNQGPPSTSVHSARDLNCGPGKDWVCEHRWPSIANMVAWRRSAGTAKVSNWHTEGSQRFFFCRGTTACIAVNLARMPWRCKLSVSMPPGMYCNIVDSDALNCERVLVRRNQTVSIDVGPTTANAFHIGRKIKGPLL